MRDATRTVRDFIYIDDTIAAIVSAGLLDNVLPQCRFG